MALYLFTGSHYQIDMLFGTTWLEIQLLRSFRVNKNYHSSGGHRAEDYG
jgi:hypothetical protein